MSGNANQTDGYKNASSENRLNIEPNFPDLTPQPYVPHSQKLIGGSICDTCNMNTTSYTKRVMGNLAWGVCCILLFTTIILFWIPFVCDACKQTQIKCTRCHMKKAVLGQHEKQ